MFDTKFAKTKNELKTQERLMDEQYSISRCHNAPIELVGGEVKNGKTKYIYSCTDCGEECDILRIK